VPVIVTAWLGDVAPKMVGYALLRASRFAGLTHPTTAWESPPSQELLGLVQSRITRGFGGGFGQVDLDHCHRTSP